MARRPRVDSIAAAKDIAASARLAISPPAHVPLSDADLPFWESVVAEFARADWTAHQLEVAALLARNMAGAVDNQNKLAAEGEVVVTEKGTPMANPRLQAMRMYSTNILAYRRSLALHARASGEARDTGKRKAMAREIEAGVTAIDDDLIARSPMLQ